MDLNRDARATLAHVIAGQVKRTASKVVVRHPGHNRPARMGDIRALEAAGLIRLDETETSYVATPAGVDVHEQHQTYRTAYTEHYGQQPKETA